MSGQAPAMSREEWERLKRSHYDCEDKWYSCPKSEEGCWDDHAGTDCNCGAEDHNKRVDEAIAKAEAQQAELEALRAEVERVRKQRYEAREYTDNDKIEAARQDEKARRKWNP